MRRRAWVTCLRRIPSSRRTRNPRTQRQPDRFRGSVRRMIGALALRRRATSEGHMRKITFGVANSLDNYIARPDGGVDWLLWTKEVSSINSKFWKTIDTVLWGRKTYE